MGKTNTSKSYVIFLLLRLQICYNQVCTQTLSFTIYSLKEQIWLQKSVFYSKYPYIFSSQNPYLTLYFLITKHNTFVTLSMAFHCLLKNPISQSTPCFKIWDCFGFVFPPFFFFFLVSSYISEAQRPPMRSTTNLAPFKIWGFYFYLFFIFK